MRQKTFTRMAGVVFVVVAVLHLLRILLGWEAVVGGWHVPLWFSWLALAFAGFLGYAAFKLSR